MKHKIKPENFRDGIKFWIQEYIFHKKRCSGFVSVYFLILHAINN